MATAEAEVLVPGPTVRTTVLRSDLPPLSVPSEQELTVSPLESAFSDAHSVRVACTWPELTV